MIKVTLGFGDIDLIFKVTEELNRSDLRVCGGGDIFFLGKQYKFYLIS